MRAAVLIALTLLTDACAQVDLGFGRRVSDEEYVLRAGIRDYYAEVAAAFAAGNAQALAALFDPDITTPMTRAAIEKWGEDFFKKHGPARFEIEKLDFERAGHVSAVVELTYRVKTRDGDGSFGGTERDQLVKRGRRWSISAWEKVR
jgi:hypothetical protein